MSRENDVKIFIAYHKDAQRIKSDILTPIHVGRAIAPEIVKNQLQDMIGDDTGDNISYKNPNYCELTALYWAWKNCDADYIGFMHYRRHLSFNLNTKFKENRWGLVDEQILNSDYLKKFELNDEKILNIVKDYDVVLPKKWDVRNAGSKNNYDHYKSSSAFLHIGDYDKALSILIEKYPEYKQAVNNYNKSHYGYYTNMFVMKKELFREYCDWMFSILFDLEKVTDLSSYDKEESRIYGYISEWLTGIFLTYKQMNSKIKIKELQRTFVHCTDSTLNVIPVCFASDNNYFMPLYVAIYSLLKNKNINDFYKINVIDGGIAENNKQMLIHLMKKFNAEIKFVKIDVNRFQQCPIEEHQHISLATYYRYLLPSLFPEYDKIIYLDCDLIVRCSLCDLFKTNIENNYIGGVIDIIYKENTERLNLEKYVNAGVLLINLKKWRQENIEQQLFDYTINNRKNIVWWDQDVLNVVLQNGIIYIDKKWNLQTTPYCIDTDYKKYLKQNSNTAIIHYVSNDKPWQWKTQQPLRKEFFRILRKTPFKILYFKCKLNDFCKYVISYRKAGYKELKIFGLVIYQRTKTDTTKNIKILNLINIERPVNNA